MADDDPDLCREIIGIHSRELIGDGGVAGMANAAPSAGVNRAAGEYRATLDASDHDPTNVVIIPGSSRKPTGAYGEPLTKDAITKAEFERPSDAEALRTFRARVAALLREIEFSAGLDDNICPSCCDQTESRAATKAHAPDCALAALLKETEA